MKLERLKEKAHELYGRQHLHDRCQIFILKEDDEKRLQVLRHEDSILGNSGTWITVPIFIPDDDKEE